MISTRYRIYQGIAMTGMGLYILFTGLEGELAQYVSPRLNPILLLTAVGLIGLAQIIFQARGKVVGVGRPLTQKEQNNRLWWFIFPFAAAFLLTVHHPEPGFMRVNGVLLQQIPGANENYAYSLLEPPPDRRTIKDWLLIYGGAPNREAMTGQTIVVTGIVHDEERINGDVFLLYQFVTGAGLGDSYAAGILVLWPEKGNLEEGNWVHVTGRLGEITLDWMPEPVPLIIAMDVQNTQPLLQAIEFIDGRD